MKILQFHSGISFGDGISNQIFDIEKILKKNNFETAIYAQYIDEKSKNYVRNIESIECTKDDILIIHHSMGFTCFNKIISLPCKKILIYHNITPTKYFDDEYTRKMICVGYQQVKNYLKYVNHAIGDSNYNRKQLLSFGYKNVDVLPIQSSLSRFDYVSTNNLILNFKNNNYINFLFVGRIVPNKKQDQILQIFNLYHKFYNPNSRLFLIGNKDDKTFLSQLENYCLNNDLNNSVFFSGKVSESDLKSYYQIADIFLCMSEHEGFGIPLIEAMKFGVPVIAQKSSAVEETLGNAGILFIKKNFPYIAAMCNEIITNSEFRAKVISVETDRIKNLEKTDTEKILIKVINELLSNSRKKTIQIQGPFETSYSLAKVNRLLAQTLSDSQKEYDISIYCTEGPGDYLPSKKDLKTYKKGPTKLYLKSKDINYPDITIRNMFPPRVYDANGGLNFQFLAWEESYISKDIINDFNEYLDGVGVSSSFVKKVLIKNGLNIPVEVIGNGVNLPHDFDSLKPYKLETNKKCRFLHISSAFPRKGVDILLKAYYNAFTNEDDVCLVLKTFPNIHNKTEAMIKELNRTFPNHPEIEWINEDLDDEQVARLYRACTCYVHSARGEGFGLPVGEAMLAKIPTIVCNNSGLSDFANEETCIPISFHPTIAQTHISNLLNPSIWYEPDLNDLTQKLKSFYDGKYDSILGKIINNAFELISTKFTWQKVAERWIDFINAVSNDKKKTDVALVSSWGNKCGIAEHSRLIIESSDKYVNYHIYPNKCDKLLKEDEFFVEKRLWNNNSDGNLNDLVRRISTDNIEIVHFQFNWGFFSIKALSEAILDLLKINKKVVLTLHCTNDSREGYSLKSISKVLNKCSGIIVHQKVDVDRLISFGIDKNIIYLMPVGQVIYSDSLIDETKRRLLLENRIVIGSYGFLLPHKGVLNVIKSLPSLKKKYPNIMYLIVCALYDCPESKQYYKECLAYVKDNNLHDNVRFITDFLPNEESINYLKSCDVTIAPYSNTQESASGAIHFLLAAQRPIITSNVHIFDEFKDFVYQCDLDSSDSIEKAITELIENKDLSNRLISKTISYNSLNSWKNRALKEVTLYKKILGN